MNQIDYENLGSRMKELRIKMKLTQAEVAKALNVTPGYISNVRITVLQCPCVSLFIMQGC